MKADLEKAREALRRMLGPDGVSEDDVYALVAVANAAIDRQAGDLSSKDSERMKAVNGLDTALARLAGRS